MLIRTVIRTRWRLGVFAAALIGIASLAAGCGSSPSGPAVASSTAAAAPAAPVSSGPGPASSTAPAGLTDCSSNTVVQPASYVLACGDGSVSASGLVWQNWGQATATAQGTISVKVCASSCATGTTEQEQGTVTVDRLQACSDGRQRYTQLSYNYTGNPGGPVVMNVACPP